MLYVQYSTVHVHPRELKLSFTGWLFVDGRNKLLQL